MTNLDKENILLQKYNNVVGLDEAGRGPIAGPVAAACVMVKPNFHLTPDLSKITDSKKLTSSKREKLYELLIHRSDLEIGLAFASVEEIEKINILQASLKAMKKSLAQLSTSPEYLLIDGNVNLDLDHPPQETIIDGDNLIFCISAASIVAKVERDRLMYQLDEQYPGYDLKNNKGYGTLKHREAIKKLGLSPIHRKSFNIKT